MAYADPEKRREYYRQWYVANKEKRKEYIRRYRKEHPEKVREWKRCWRTENPEKQLEYNRRIREHLRTQVLSILGGKCIRCGLDDSQVLQIDHINGGGTAEIRALGRNHNKFLRKVMGDSSPYQLLCPTCNWRKRLEKGECGNLKGARLG